MTRRPQEGGGGRKETPSLGQQQKKSTAALYYIFPSSSPFKSSSHFPSSFLFFFLLFQTFNMTESNTFIVPSNFFPPSVESYSPSAIHSLSLSLWWVNVIINLHYPRRRSLFIISVGDTSYNSPRVLMANSFSVSAKKSG